MGSVNCMPLVGLKWVLSGYLEWEYWLNIIFGLHFFLFLTQRQRGEGVMMLVSFIFIILCLNEEYYYLLLLPLFIGLKVALYSFSGSIPPKFEHKLRRHKQRFGKIAATVASDDQGCSDIGVVIATKWRYYLFYLQQYFSALGSVPLKIVYGGFFLQ